MRYYVYRHCKWNSRNCFYYKKKKLHSYTVKLSSVLSKGLQVGASVAHNGCCLTVTLIDQPYYTFDIIQETLKNTNLGIVNVGEYINIERSSKYGDEIGGHLVSGHVLNTAEIYKISSLDDNYKLWLKPYNQSLMKYIFYKGFICIDGISLTVGTVEKNLFCVNLIPETLSRTTIKYKKYGSLVNIEIDFYTHTIVDTIERMINQKRYIHNENN